MLFLCSANFSDVFAIFSFALGFSKHLNALLTLNGIVFGTLNFVAFFATSYFAAEVSREDSMIRKRMKSVAFNLSVSKDTKGHLLRRFIQSKTGIVLTAVGVMNFSRGFLLTYAGVLVTYNLLMVQLNTID
ncbi:hypothetical protein AVEN_170553-1 [Araneus ventricosus]|uniref:Gustatory receptor n=1 Tax=Araneus ventricosus TaxID=182803 RepID=A0A4Y2RKZ5_ARAVE|nr:hypothetical protein AVEN_170553-1 [Araneus ventricosus]